LRSPAGHAIGDLPTGEEETKFSFGAISRTSGVPADVLSPLRFGFELLQLGVEGISRGDDPDRPAVLDHRGVAQAAETRARALMTIKS